MDIRLLLQVLITSWNCLNFHNARSYIILEFIFFHDTINIILIFIISIVTSVIYDLLFNRITNLFLTENQNLESIWIIIPSLTLIKIGVPSLYLLYITDDIVDSSIRLKVNAQQWFWSYEYTDFFTPELDSSLEFDSYIINSSDITEGTVRLLDTYMRPALPFIVQARVLISRLDVLHCWTVPALGVKVDANPGRINQVQFFAYQPGVFYGQCSEICGANHRFIPIALEFYRADVFLSWIDVYRH